MGLYSPFLSLGTSTEIGPSDVWTVLWYVPFLEPPEFFPDGSLFAVAERCAYLRPQQRFDRLLRHDEHGLPHRSLETFGFRYRFLD